MIKGKKISIIIPCKNEEAALYSMLQKCPSYIDEVIVVDNGSSDNTPIIARKNGAKLVHEPRNINGVGYGYAHQSGMQYATGDYIVGMDGDNTYPIEAIKDVIEYMTNSSADFVSCARFPLASSGALSFIRKLGVRILNLEVTFLYGYHIKDILSGMWIMRKDVISKLNVENGEWNFSPEIKLAAITHPEIHFSEYHITHDIRLNGLSKQEIWKTGFNHLFYILKRRMTVDKSFGLQQLKLATSKVRYHLRSMSAVFSK